MFDLSQYSERLKRVFNAYGRVQAEASSLVAPVVLFGDLDRPGLRVPLDAADAFYSRAITAGAGTHYYGVFNRSDDHHLIVEHVHFCSSHAAGFITVNLAEISTGLPLEDTNARLSVPETNSAVVSMRSPLAYCTEINLGGSRIAALRWQQNVPMEHPTRWAIPPRNSLQLVWTTTAVQNTALTMNLRSYRS